MKSEKPRSQQPSIEDIERAAWFARLALGDMSAPEPEHAKQPVIFRVMP